MADVEINPEEITITEEEIKRLQDEKLQRAKRKEEEAKADVAKAQIYKELQSGVEAAGDKIIELIRTAEVTSASATVGGDTIQCRVKTGKKTWRTSTDRYAMKHVNLETWQTYNFISLVMDLFKVDCDNPFLKPLHQRAQERAQDLLPQPGPNDYWSPYKLHFDFTESIKELIEKKALAECKQLVVKIYDEFRKVMSSGTLDQKKREHELRQALKKLRPALLQALQAGLTDDELQKEVDEARVKMVMEV